MAVHLVNPSDLAFGIGVIVPRWLYVLAAATPSRFGDPHLVDEGVEAFDPDRVQPGDVVGIGIHTLNALRGYKVGKLARSKGAFVVFGGIHAGLYPEEAYEMGGAHSVVTGDGDIAWADVLADCANGGPRKLYEGGHVAADELLSARWDLLDGEHYMWPSVQTVRGCPKHCSFCSVWRTDGQHPRQRSPEAVVEEIVELRRKGFRFIALADDNFYPVTIQDLKLARERGDKKRLEELESMRKERFELMALMSKLPKNMAYFTQITMEAAEDPEFLDAMREAQIKGALVGIESVTPEGLKAVYKDFNYAGDDLVKRLRVFSQHGVYVLGSFIFGLPTDRKDTFQATSKLAQQAEIAFAQFVTITPFPGTIDFKNWEKSQSENEKRIEGFPFSRYWLIPSWSRQKVYMAHPSMSQEEIREGTRWTWNRFYSLRNIWKRSSITPTLRSRIAFVLLSKLYRQMYANTGLSTDSARTNKARKWARLIARPAQRLFRDAPMQELQVPTR